MLPTPPGDVGTALPADLVSQFGGGDLDAHVGWTVQLLSVADDGWPNVALLSVGEVLALDGSSLRLALWPETRTTANLTRTGQALMTFVHDRAFYTVRLAVRRLADLPGPPGRAVFDGEIVELRRDEVSYAELKTGIIFELFDRAAVVARWRATIQALRAIGPPRGGA